MIDNATFKTSFIVTDFKPEYCFEKCNYLHNMEWIWIYESQQ